MRPTNWWLSWKAKWSSRSLGRSSHPAIGEEFLIPAAAIHSARNIGATTARWLYGYKR